MKRKTKTKIVAAAIGISTLFAGCGNNAAPALEGEVSQTQDEQEVQNVSETQSAPKDASIFIEKMHAQFDDLSMDYRPWTRWWMAEGLHTDETIINGVKELYDMGIGGIEIVCMPEPNVDNDYVSPVSQETGEPISARSLYSWGSEEWAHDTELIIQETTKYGMGFSMTSGTHWSNANLPEEDLMPDDDGAGKSLGYTIQTLEEGQSFNGALNRSFKSGDEVKRQDLVAVVAMKRDTSSDAEIVSEGDEAGTIAATGGEVFMVYDDSATQVLTDLVQRDGTAVTEETKKDPSGEAAFTLNWTPEEDGIWDIYTFWIQATGQSPTPSATRNFTINYIDPYGMNEFLKYYDENFFTPELKELIRENGKGEMYMDSLEISTMNGQTGQFWGYTLMDEFEKRHGYDLTPYLPYIIRQGNRSHFTVYPTKMLGSDGVKEEKIHVDLYDTMTDMYIENILLPLKTYLNDELNMKLRAEISYNLPYEFTTPGRAVDYVETESLDFATQIDSFRELAGAAHVYGRRYSSETGALGAENYMNGQEKFMEIINTQFASGVAHTVFHGYSSIQGADGNPEEGDWDGTYWPGHEGMYDMYSERWGSRQPASEHYGDWMEMLIRNQAVLQQGKPQMDIAVMHTDYYNSRDYYGDSGYDNMRARKALFLKDLSLQDAGYTYDYIAPENLELLEEEGITDYREGEGLIPDNAGYQAILLYQDSISVESAEKILDLAKRGLPVVIVNGLTERVLSAPDWGSADNSISRTYKKACAYTLSNDGRDGELAAVMDELRSLSNVIELNPENLPKDPKNPNPNELGYEDAYFTGKTGILEALHDLNVYPRAGFEEPNQNFLTFARRTNDEFYVWVYNFMTGNEEADTVKLSLGEEGKPYEIDTWTGDVSEVAAYSIVDGRTNLELTLKPGETTVIALDLTDEGGGIHITSTNANKALVKDGAMAVYATQSGSYKTVLSDGTEVTSDVEVPEEISLNRWNLTVEDWNAGEKQYVKEDRGLGYETTEVYWDTKKTTIEAGETELVPWSEIPEVGDEVSGIGYYSTSFTLPEDWSEANGAILSIESLGGNTAEVFINGVKAEGFDFVARKMDISGLVKAGENTIEVNVSTTLRNRLIERGYPMLVGTKEDSWFDNVVMPTDEYGLIGDVTITPYTIAEVN